MSPSHLRRSLLGVALGVASLSAAFATAPASADPTDPIEVTLISVNDFHGNIADPSTMQFAGTIEKLRAAHGEDSTLVLSAGDMLKVDDTTQNPKSLHFVPTLNVLNALDVGASAVGNHEFHNWYGALRTTITDYADFPLLSANILKSNAREFDAYKIFDVAGLKVAVIGATTRSTTVLDPRVLVCGLKFTDPVDAVNATADNLATSSSPPDIIVAVYHEGAKIDGSTNDLTRVISATSAAVDVVFAGHTHQSQEFAGSVPGVPGKTRPVVQSLPNGEAVSKVVLTVDPTTKDVLGYNMEHVPRTTDLAATLIATYPRVAAVDVIVQDAIDNPPGLTTDPVSLC